MFGLERERGQRIQNRAILLVLFFASVIAIVTFINLQVAPTLPIELLKPPTPTPNIFSTPLSSPVLQSDSELPLPTTTLAVAPTVTLAGASAGNTEVPLDSTEQLSTIQANENLFPDVEIGVCQAEVTISAPPSGVTISGEVAIFGTANSENFGYYDLELFGPATNEQWISVLEALQREPLIDDILVTIDMEGLDPGSYLLRLVVVDNQGEEAGQCVVQLEVE